VDRNGEQRQSIRLGLSPDQSPDVGGTWSPDGAEIVINVLDDSGNSRLALVDVDGSGPARVLGEQKAGVSEESAAWSPDGKLIAFIRVNEDASNGNEIWLIRPDGSGRRRITDGADDVSWSKDGESLFFDASFPRSSGRYSVPVSGGEARRIGPVPADAAVADAREPGGQRVFHYEKDGGLSVTRLDGSGKKVLTRPYVDAAPRWSPDGMRIAFTRGSEDSRSWDVHLIDSSGKNDRRVCQGGSPSWLPDGRLVIERKQGFAFADTDPERVAVPVEGRTPVISPDGTSIAFVRDRTIFMAPSTPKEGQGSFQAVQSTLYVQGWNGTGLRTLAKTPGPPEIVYDAPVWAPDGQSILIQEHDPLGGGSSRIRQVPVGGGEAKTVVSNEGFSDLEFLAVAPDSKRIAFASDRGIEVVELDDGGRKTIVPADVVSVLGIEWAPDGTRLAYVVDHPENESVFELYVVDRDGSHRRRVSQPGDAVGAFDWRPQAPNE
jgi:Tol biopolymer transport system component